MNTQRLYIADPFDDENIKLYEEFEKANESEAKTSSFFKEIRKRYTKEDYSVLEKSGIEINQNLYIMENNAIKDNCFIKGERDIKYCELFFARLKEEPKNRVLLSYVCDYVFNTLGMENVFISIEDNNRNFIDNLISKGFENIGEVNGKNTFIKLKEEKEKKRSI